MIFLAVATLVSVGNTSQNLRFGYNPQDSGDMPGKTFKPSEMLGRTLNSQATTKKSPTSQGSSVMNSLLEKASHHGYQSDTHRRLAYSDSDGFCGLWCQTKRTAKYAARTINATGEAFDKLTADAIDAVDAAADAVEETLEAAANAAKNVAVKTGQLAAELADEAATTIHDAVADLGDDVLHGIRTWAKNIVLDRSEDWFWPEQTSYFSKYKRNNHHGVMDIWGNYSKPTCTACKPHADRIFEALDAAYEHRNTWDAEGRCYLLQSEADNLQIIADAAKKHVDQHQLDRRNRRQNRLYISQLYLQAILKRVDVVADNDKA